MASGTSRKRQLKAARQALSEKQTKIAEDTDEDIGSLKNRLFKAAQQTQLLEQQLADQAKVYEDLQNNFNASQDLINTLHAEISSLKSKNSNIYHQFGMTTLQACHLKAWLHDISNPSPEES
jgi:septal ring factor EnvC (AmiA/AmiB activator)